MLRSIYLPALLFAGLGLAKSLGYWTMHNFRRICDDDGLECDYYFSINQDEGDSSTPGAVCHIEVTGDGFDGGTPANKTSFDRRKCNDDAGDSDVGAEYTINGGYSDLGFITVVVTDTHENANAFFAFADEQLAKGMTVSEQSRLAYVVGTFDITDGNVVVGKEKRAGDVEWQVVNLQQDHDEATGENQLTFAIQVAPGSMSPCTIVTKTVGSFSTEKCIDSNWIVSWDYSAAGDTATMTVVEPNMKMEASFRWKGVSSTPNLGHSLRSIAYPHEDDTVR